MKLLGIQIATFKVVIKSHWTKGKGYHKDLEVPSDEENDDNDDDEKDDDVKIDETMEEDET